MAGDTREAEQRRRRAEGDRVREVREATGRRQIDFAVLLVAEAQRQGMSWLNYDNSIVSKLENATRQMSLDDVTVIAAIDPERRGKLWLSWGEERDSLAGISRKPKKTREQLEKELRERERKDRAG